MICWVWVIFEHDYKLTFIVKIENSKQKLFNFVHTTVHITVCYAKRLNLKFGGSLLNIYQEINLPLTHAKKPQGSHFRHSAWF